MVLALGNLYSADSEALQGKLASQIAEVNGVISTRTIDSRWTELTFRSRAPLTQAEIEQTRIPGFQQPAHYDYQLWMAVSNHVLLLSLSASVVEAFAGRHLARHRIHLRRTQIRVSDLIRDLIKSPEQYALTHIHARVGGFGESLKTISLWGDDLGDAQFVRDSTHILFGTQCGLRKVEDDRELLRITNEGKISFYFEESRFKAVEALLSFLYTKAYFID